MAESQPAGAPAINTNIESGDFNEKSAPPPAATKPKVEEEEEEDEDIDALIEDLESQDGHGFEEEEEGDGSPAGAGRVIPEEMLQTDTRVGLTDSEFCDSGSCRRPGNLMLTDDE